ncbi:MAG: tetratricopeptide repeat protein [Chthonomonadales bacterium]
MTTQEAGREYRIAAAVIAIIVIAAGVYSSALQGMMIWDDHVLVGGSGIGGGHSFASCFTQPFLEHYYRPLVSVTFFLDHLMWSTTPLGYHQTNILIHVLTTLALIGTLYAAFGRWRIALLGSLLFAVQPAQVSTTAWIGGRTDALCSLFVCLYAWALFAASKKQGGKRALLYAAAVAAFGAAIFTKEQALALLPCTALAILWFETSPRTEKMRTLAAVMTPSLLIAALYVATWMAIGPPRPAALPASLASQVAEGLQSVTYYTLLFIAPSPRWLHTFCLGWFEHHPVWSLAIGSAALAGSLWLLASLLKRRECTAAWFLIFIWLSALPVLNFLPLPSLLVAPYRVGITGIGVAALLAWAINSIGYARGNALRATLRWSAAGAFFVWYAALTLWGVGQWKDARTLFGTTVRYDPYSIIARMNLAAELLNDHQSQAAERQMEALLTLLYGSNAWRNPQSAWQVFHQDESVRRRVADNQGNFVRPEQWLGAIFAQLGFAREQRKDDDGALACFQASDLLDPANAGASEGFGYIALHRKEYAKAVRYFARALAGQPKRTDLHAALGTAYAHLGKWPEARNEFALCVRRAGWVGLAYSKLAEAQIHLGDLDGAAATLSAGLAKAPSRADLMEMLQKVRRLQTERKHASSA